MDIGSQFARSAITFSNKIARQRTHSNARAGNIGRILKGSVPACKAAYGYRYRRDAEITNGRIYIRKAWWELNDLRIKALAGGIWAPNRVCKVIHCRCYTGKNFYNSSCYVPNPKRPLGNVTAQIKRTISRPKPEVEQVKIRWAESHCELVTNRLNIKLDKPILAVTIIQLTYSDVS